MKQEKQDERRRQIEAAAFELLAEKGYRSTSMLQIAKRASASNHTLYAWYGSKQALFKSVIEENSKNIKRLLSDALGECDDTLQTLETLGPMLLRFATDEKAVIINRAAIIDAAETGILGTVIEEEARGGIYPLICSLMSRLRAAGIFQQDTDPEDAADSYIGFLFGEVRMRQAFGSLGPLTTDEVNRRAARAFTLICRLYGVQKED